MPIILIFTQNRIFYLTIDDYCGTFELKRKLINSGTMFAKKLLTSKA